MNRSLAFLVYLNFILYSVAQTTKDKGQIISDLDLSSKAHPKETIYLQTSKGIYETEEDLWFKGYILNSQTLEPSLRSKIMYLYLIQKKTGKVAWKEKYEIEGGFVSGHLFLSDTLDAGSYQLEAFTSQSVSNVEGINRNVRQVRILKNIKDDQVQTQDTDSSEIDFRTFPEGGKLVVGYSNKLAFKAVDQNGLPVKIKGVLFENNVAIDSFQSVHAGMGAIQLTPSANASYHIELDHLKEAKKYEIPRVHQNGYILTLLEQDKDFLMFEVRKTDKQVGEFYVRTQVRGVAYSLASGKIKNKARVKIPLTEMPQGIAEVTLYDGNMIPVCERLVYINDHKKLYIKSTINDHYQTREKVTVELEVKDHKNRPVQAHLGVTIYDKEYHNQLDDKIIQGHFLLSNSVKGRLFNPSYYFDEDHKERLAHLDLVLLTQGWRNFVWNDRDQSSRNYKRTQLSDTLQGKVVFTRKKKKVVTDQGVVMMYSPVNNQDKRLLLIDTTGIFDIVPAHLKFAEKNYLYLKPVTPPKSKFEASIQISDPFNKVDTLREHLTTSYPTDLFKPDPEPTAIPFQYESGTIELDEVTLKANDPRVIRDKYLGRLDSILGLEVIDYIAEPCFTLNCPFHPYQPGNKLAVVGETYQKYVGETTVNGQRQEIREKVLYTKPVITEEYILKRFNLTRIKSFYGRREFYQPVYDDMNINDPFPDHRNTLLWSPELVTDKNGKARVEFFCSDIRSKFILTIEGVDGTGQIGRFNSEFVVQKK